MKIITCAICKAAFNSETNSAFCGKCEPIAPKGIILECKHCRGASPMPGHAIKHKFWCPDLNGGGWSEQPPNEPGEYEIVCAEFMEPKAIVVKPLPDKIGLYTSLVGAIEVNRARALYTFIRWRRFKRIIDKPSESPSLGGSGGHGGAAVRNSVDGWTPIPPIPSHPSEHFKDDVHDGTTKMICDALLCGDMYAVPMRLRPRIASIIRDSCNAVTPLQSLPPIGEYESALAEAGADELCLDLDALTECMRAIRGDYIRLLDYANVCASEVQKRIPTSHETNEAFSDMISAVSDMRQTRQRAPERKPGPSSDQFTTHGPGPATPTPG